jgi:hypothetical protein
MSLKFVMPAKTRMDNYFSSKEFEMSDDWKIKHWGVKDLIKAGPTPMDLLRILMEFNPEFSDYECVVDTFKEVVILRARVSAITEEK